MDDKKIRVLHIITGLDTGGAEMMLYKILQNSEDSHYQHIVISLQNEGGLGKKIRALGIAVYTMNMQVNLSSFKRLWPLRKLIKKLNPTVIQTWMYHANFVVALLKLTLIRTPIIWSIRQSSAGKYEKPLTRKIIKLTSFLSFIPKRIIYNSQLSATQHESLGFHQRKTVLIANGFDCEVFKPSQEIKQTFKEINQLPVDAIVIGHLARYHPIKDHQTFIKAAMLIAREYPHVYFVMAGKEVTTRNPVLMNAITDFHERFLLLDEQVPERLIPAFDILVLSSLCEAFPNVIGEAMACGVPCVSTDVGDVKSIMADLGVLVPVGDETSLAQGIKQLLDLAFEKRQALAIAVRERILNHYTIKKITEQYETVYQAYQD